MKTTIEMAREAAGDDWKLFREFMPEIHRLAELVRADERNRTWTQEHWTEYERSIAAVERELIAQSMDKQAELAADDIDRQWAQEMAAAIRARGQE
jgi:hypothetical protein